MEECCPNKPREHVQGRWRSVVPPGPENNRCWEVRGVLSHQALTADAGRVELFFSPTGPENRCWEGGGVLSHRP